ncbi:hypothetical protein D3C76_1275990 [compost metagenome]
MKDQNISSEYYLQQKVQLNMQLFLSFAPMIEDTFKDLWESLLHGFSLCETLINELEYNQDAVPPRNSYIYWWLYEVATEEDKLALNGQGMNHNELKKMIFKYKANEQLNVKLHEAVANIQMLRESKIAEKLSSDIGQVLAPFQMILNRTRTVVREG